MGSIAGDNIRVVHLQFGTTAFGNYTIRQHEGLLEAGIDSYVLSLYSDVMGNARVEQVGMTDRYLRTLFSKLSARRSKGKVDRSMGFQFDSSIIDVTKHEFVRKADYIYVHWAWNDFLGISSLRKLAKLGKPIILVLHDMWFTTGGCLHSFDCDKFLDQCGACPIFGSKTWKDYSYEQFNRKKVFYNEFNNLFLISPSFWLKGLAEKSALTKDKPIFRIPNMINGNVFKPVDKQVAKQILGMDQYEYVFTFGAFNIYSPYKGWAYLVKSLELLKKRLEGKNVGILIFGSAPNSTISDAIPFPVKFLGYVQDDYATSVIFNATNVFLAPSVADNLPTTIIESLTCKTPVVGFQVGGIPEMIHHKKNGYLAKYRDAEDFAEGILFCMETPLDVFIGDEYSSAQIKKQHLDLYRYIESQS